MQAPCAYEHLSPSEMATVAVSPSITNVPDYLPLSLTATAAFTLAMGGVH